MADDFLATVIATFVGAGAVVCSGIISESYRRHKEMQGTASAIAGEIYALIDMTERRQYVKNFQNILALLKQGQDQSISNIVGDTTPRLDPIIERHIERLGLLPSNSQLPRKITTFYTYLQGIRLDIIHIATQKVSIGEKVSYLEEDLALWDETAKLGKAITSELQRISEQAWSPFSLLNQLFQKINK